MFAGKLPYDAALQGRLGCTTVGMRDSDLHVWKPSHSALRWTQWSRGTVVTRVLFDSTVTCDTEQSMHEMLARALRHLEPNAP